MTTRAKRGEATGWRSVCERVGKQDAYSYNFDLPVAFGLVSSVACIAKRFGRVGSGLVSLDRG